MNAIWIIARLSWLRLLRGRTKWVSCLLALLPIVLASLLTVGGAESFLVWKVSTYFALSLPVLIAVAVHLAPAVGDELESRTYTYLWSRPVPRRALLLGKLVATAPVVLALFALSLSVTWLIAWQGDAGEQLAELGQVLLAVLFVVVSASALTLAVSALLPKRPLAFLLGYVLLSERLFDVIPFVQQLSIAFHAAAISGQHPPFLHPESPLHGVVTLLLLSALWLGVAIWRVERSEYALPDA